MVESSAQLVPAEVVCCSFCGKNHLEVKVMMTAPLACICDECTALAVKIVAERTALSQPNDEGEGK